MVNQMISMFIKNIPALKKNYLLNDGLFILWELQKLYVRLRENAERVNGKEDLEHS